MVRKFSVFFIMINLPFLTVTYLFGVETFVDSFKYPNSFQFIKTDDFLHLDTNAGFILYEKANHQGYMINERDTILYHTSQDILQQSMVYRIVSENGVTRYYVFTGDKETLDTIVNEHQIIGKIKGRFNDTIWTSLCLYIWDLSVDNLNAISFFSP